MADVSMICGDARSIPLSDESVNCVVTSPPYWGLRDYGLAGQLGLERTPEEYIDQMLQVFREVCRVLRHDGTLWLNMGDCYATGAGKVGECPGGGERGARWKGEITQYRDEKRRQHGQPNKNGHGKPQKMRDDSKGRGTPARADGSGGHVYFGPMTQPNRMPIEGLKPKDLVGMPWRLAFALQVDGWYLRSDIIWSKPNPMPESVIDRPTKSHEYIFLLSKNERYYYNAEAIKERSVSGDLRKPYAPGQIDARGNGHDRGGGTLRKMGVPTGWDTDKRSHDNIHKDGRRRPKAWDEDMGSNRTLITGYARKQNEVGNRRYTGFNARWDESEEAGEVGVTRNKRSVWTVGTQAFPEARFATFPEELIKPCILAGCPAGRVVLDPFAGSGTTMLVARELQCHGVGLELNPAYIEIAKRRLRQQVLAFEVDGEYSREV